MCGGRYLSSASLPPTLCRPLHAGRVPARCFTSPCTVFREMKRFMKRKAVLCAGIIMLY